MVRNLKNVQLLRSEEIWILNYQIQSSEQELYELFLKHKIKYPKIGFYESWGPGKILHPDSKDLIFINIKLKKYNNFMKDIQKIGNIRNFSSGKEIITANIKTSYKIFGVLGFDLNTFENQTCKVLFVDSNSIYFFAEDDLGYFVLPQSFSSYFLELINSLSNSKNLSSKTEIELENYFNFLIKSNP